MNKLSDYSFWDATTARCMTKVGLADADQDAVNALCLGVHQAIHRACDEGVYCTCYYAESVAGHIIEHAMQYFIALGYEAEKSMQVGDKNLLYTITIRWSQR